MLRFSVASHWITATHFFLFERICSVFCAIWQSITPFSQQVNGHAPFFRTIFSVFGDIERICSVFYAVFEPFSNSKVGGLNRSEWVDMLRFRQFGCLVVWLDLLEFKQTTMPSPIKERRHHHHTNVFVKREQRKLACSAERRADERANGEPSSLALS